MMTGETTATGATGTTMSTTFVSTNVKNPPAVIDGMDYELWKKELALWC